MTSPPPAVRPSNAGNPAPLAVEVRLDIGKSKEGNPIKGLFKRISLPDADRLVEFGWAEWRGSGRRRHVELTDHAPISSLFGMRGRDGTRPMRSDGTLGYRARGQAFGDSRYHREPIPRTL